MMEVINGVCFCKSCGYQTPVKTNIRRHIEANHVSVQYTCKICNTQHPTKTALQKHNRKNHYQPENLF